MNQIMLAEHNRQAILTIRGCKVMLDADLARLYGITTKRLNQQVKRNKERFPEDFAFQLTMEEKNEVVTICDHLGRLKFSSQLPYAFTEHGAIALASVLNSPIAIRASIQVVRAFVRLREMLTSHKDFSARLDQLERKYGYHDQKLKEVFDAIRQLTMPPPESSRRLGFRQH